MDCYGTETTWELQNSTGSAIYSGSGYSDNQPGLVTMDPWCLNYGCYTYVIMDSYGDGLFGGVFCAQDGSVSILYNTDTLANLPEANIDFGNQTSLQFCVSQAGIEFADWNDFTVYPNPFTEQIVVNTQGASEVNLLDITGKVIQHKKIDSSSTLLNFSDSLSNGTYFICVTLNDGRVRTKKLLKQ